MKYDPQKHHRQSIRLQGYDYRRPGAYFVTLVAHQREALFGELVDGAVRLNEFGYLAMNEWRRLAKRFEYVLVDEFIVMPNHLHGVLVILDEKPTHPTLQASHEPYGMVGAGQENSTSPGEPPLAPPLQTPPQPDPLPGEPPPAPPLRTPPLPATTGLPTASLDGRVGAGQEELALCREPPLAPPLQTSPGEPPLAPPLHTPPQQTPHLQGASGLPPASLGAIVGAYKSTTARLINGLRHTPGLPVWQRNYFEHILRDELELNRIRQYIQNNPLKWTEDRENPARSG